MPQRCWQVSMKQEKIQLNQPAGAGPDAESGARYPSASSSASSPTSTESSSSILSESSHESAINKELRRLNRALHALSACNQALAQAGSEQELVQQICEIIVQAGGYPVGGIANPPKEEEKKRPPLSHAGHRR